ncbi:MAG: hypothetical protein LBV63_04915 [Candidatus Methanoplasma sp.]|jgi:hypothetical protein|nr:hypothetical protein [Candidatus Methanoplasma sp.]
MNGLRLVVAYTISDIIAIMIMVTCAYLGYVTLVYGSIITLAWATGAAVYVVITLMKNRETGVTFDESGVCIISAMMNITVPYSDISSVDLRSGVEYGIRTFGYSDGTVYSGSFSNTEFGQYKLSVNNKIQSSVVVRHIKGILVFNCTNEDSTVLAYNRVKGRSNNLLPQ